MAELRILTPYACWVALVLLLYSAAVNVALVGEAVKGLPGLMK